MRMRKRGLITMAVPAAALLLTGCFHNFHELRPSEWGDGVEVGYLATSLLWEHDEDASTAVNNVTVSAKNGMASLTECYKDQHEASSELMQLPTGEYDVLVTANMSAAADFILTGMPATKGTASDLMLGSVTVSLKNPASSPAQAWYGTDHVSISSDKVTVAEPKLQRLLSVISLNLDNVPAGTGVVISISNVAKSIILNAQDVNGRYGKPASGASDSITIGVFNPTADGALGVREFRMLPTASDKERCLITIDVTTPEGQHLTYIGDAPRTECGKSYTLNLDYNTLKPYMYVASSEISEWNEGWSVSGEILNPDE